MRLFSAFGRKEVTPDILVRDLSCPDNTPVFYAKQTHSDHFLDLSNVKGLEKKSAELPLFEGDSLILFPDELKLSSAAVAVQTADCLPILFKCQLQKKSDHIALGVIHAGWRGLISEIAPKTIRYVMNKLGASPSDFSLFVGPSIEQKCYEIGLDVRDKFKKLGFEDQMEYQGDEKVKWNLDLRSVLLKQIKQLGIETVKTDDTCTKCSTNDYASFRRENSKTSRNWSLIGYVKEN